MRRGSPIPKNVAPRPRSPLGEISSPSKRARRSRVSQIVLPTFEEGDELEEESLDIDDESDQDGEDNALESEQEAVINILLSRICSVYFQFVQYLLLCCFCFHSFNQEL